MEGAASGAVSRFVQTCFALERNRGLRGPGIRNFVVQFILQCSGSEESLKTSKTLLNKLNLVLISVLKQEWPHNWPTFINEIITACHSSLSVCENNMIILRLLSEEVFDYSADQMTSAKTRNLKSTMCAEFSQIFQLCTEILNTATQPSLVKATLETLLRFCNWIPLGYIFETPLIETLRSRFLSVPEFRNVTLQCLTEIGGLQTSAPGQVTNYDEQLVKMFTETLSTISDIIPIQMDLQNTYPSSNSKDQEFVQNLALFLCNFFSMHLNVCPLFPFLLSVVLLTAAKLVENLPNRDYLTHGHLYLIRISQIDDREIFKICLDYWIKLVQELYNEMQTLPITDVNSLMGVGSLTSSGAPNPALLTSYPLRKHKYSEVLSNLRIVMIEKMVRPEEVLIVENDEGEIVREFVKESDTVTLYKTIREALVYLTHLDVVDTEQIMTEKLAKQVDGTEWSWHNCNVLCWAIGSISLAMNEETEKRFLVTVIKDLLGLTEMKRGKDNKAVVASNIMYIVGQYPRFLKAHWKFLKTVVNKLFEFMHESHEGKHRRFGAPAEAITTDNAAGVQDMACDTFIKIAKQCRRHFVALQPSEHEPFIEEIVRNLQRITCDLTPQQVHTFYEACGYMVAAQGNRNQQERLLGELMSLPNMAWDQIIKAATENPTSLQDADTIKIIGNIMKTNVSACSSIGPYFYPQIGRIYHDMLLMYRETSGLISNAVVRDGKCSPPPLGGPRWRTRALTCGFVRRNRDQDAQGPRPPNHQEGDPQAHRDLCRQGGGLDGRQGSDSPAPTGLGAGRLPSQCCRGARRRGPQGDGGRHNQALRFDGGPGAHHHGERVRVHAGDDQQGLLRVPRAPGRVLQPAPGDQPALLPGAAQVGQPAVQVRH